MEKQITLTLPDSVLDRAAGLAAVVSRPVEKILRETLEMALPDMGHEVLPPVSSLSDEDVLRLSKAQWKVGKIHGYQNCSTNSRPGF